MKSGGLTLWNVVAICETSKTSWKMGKTPCERRFGEPFQGPMIHFGAMVEYHLISLARKCCQESFLAMSQSRGELGQEIF